MDKRKSTKKHASSDGAKPWEKGNPKSAGEHVHLSPSGKASAKRHAKAAGRPYPNLVDNMRASAASKK